MRHNHRNISLLILFLLFLATAPAYGVNLLENAGILDGSLARGSYLAVTDGGYSMFNNPAILARVGEDRTSGGRSGLVLGGVSYAPDILEGFGAIGQARDFFGWGVGIHYYSLGQDLFKNMDEKDISDLSGHDFFGVDYERIKLTGSFGKKAFTYRDKNENKYSFSIGAQVNSAFVTAKMDSLDYKANYFSADVGIIGSITLSKAPNISDFRAGLTVENFPAIVSADDIDGDGDDDGDVSSSLRINSSLLFMKRWQPMIDLRKHALSVGTAYWFKDDFSGRMIFTFPSDRGSIFGIGINKRFGGYLADISLKTQKDTEYALNIMFKTFWGKRDLCPGEPEDKDGFEDDDGCPDPDNDEDGILDEKDNCPDQAEDFDKFEDEDGCPDLDNDGDGISDVDDLCPNVAEDKNNYKDNDGCPDDLDNDQVYEDNDQCPDQPETKNFYKDDDGCPDEFLEEYAEKIRFDYNTATFQSESYDNLYDIGDFLESHSNIKVEIGVYHTDQDLAKQRAEAIKAFIIQNYNVKETNITAASLRERKGNHDVYFQYLGND